MVIGSQWKWRGDCGRQDGNGNGNSSEFQDGNGNGNFGKSILKNNKTAGNNFDSNGAPKNLCSQVCGEVQVDFLVWIIISVATPAEPRGQKYFFFLCKSWAVKKF